MSRKFRSLFSFSRQSSIGFILLMITISINSHITTYAQESTSVSNEDDNKTTSDQNQTTTSDIQQPAAMSDIDTNSTQSSQGDEQPPVNSSTSGSTDQGTGNATAPSVSDLDNANQTSANPEQDYLTNGENQTATSSTSNATSINQNIQDESYQNINGTSVSNSTSIEQDNNNTSTSGNYSNDTTPIYSGNNNSTDTLSENSSTNYNNSTQTSAVDVENNSNANMTSIADNSTNGLPSQNTTNISTALHPPPDFEISIDPLTLSVNAGSTTTYSVTITSLNGFNSNVSLAITPKSIPGITTSLGSNITKPPVNASATSLLTIQSDATAHSGKYKLKVTGSAANITGTRSASVTLEVIGQNIIATANDTLGLDAIALTPILIMDIEDNRIFEDHGLSVEKMVFISTTVVNNYNKTQPFILVMEIRDKTHHTLSIQLLRGILNPNGEMGVDVSWIPDKSGDYEILSFVIDSMQDPQPLSAVIGKIWTVTD